MNFINFLRFIGSLISLSFFVPLIILKFRLTKYYYLTPYQEKKIKNYIKILTVSFRFIIGILLISVQFPFLLKFLFPKKDFSLESYGKHISPIIASAGFIVLFTLDSDDIQYVLNQFGIKF